MPSSLIEPLLLQLVRMMTMRISLACLALLCSSAAFVSPTSRLRAPVAKLSRPTMLTPPRALLSNAEIESAFTVATFLPQPFWLFLILAPNTKITDAVMRPWWPLLSVCLVHVFIVIVSLGQPGGTAPMAEFMDVFDPNGAPQRAMVGMMQYPNFVSEEWSHVLAWDLFVGRYIWLDGRARGVFTPHSTLLCNLIGPPGLFLHFATCLLSGKGLPPTGPPATEDA